MKSQVIPIIILLGEDDEDDRLLIADALREFRLANHLKLVNDGEQLMDYLYHRGSYAPPAASPRPDLVLLDLNMPRKDGIEVLQEMKADPRLRAIPVVILTTSESEADVERGYRLHANAFVVKPGTFDGLVTVLRGTIEYWFETVQLPARQKDN